MYLQFSFLFGGERESFLPFHWYGGAVVAILGISLRVVSLFPNWRPVVRVTRRSLGIRRSGGEEISRCLGTDFRRKWVQDMKCLSNRKMRFLSLIRLCVNRVALMAGHKV